MLEATAPGAEPELHATMIDALEAVGGDPSLLAHHATAAGDVPRILRYAPEAAAEAARSGAHREAVAFYETALRHVGDDPATRAALLEALSVELVPHRPPARRHRGAGAGARAAPGNGGRRRRSAPRTPRSPASRGTRPTVALAERHVAAAIEILSATDDRRALGLRPGPAVFLAAWRGDARSGATVGRPGGADRRRAGRRRRAAHHRVHRGRAGAPARGRPAGAGRPARGHRRRSCAPARRTSRRHR